MAWPTFSRKRFVTTAVSIARQAYTGARPSGWQLAENFQIQTQTLAQFDERLKNGLTIVQHVDPLLSNDSVNNGRY
jgi:hypothetical protein